MNKIIAIFILSAFMSINYSIPVYALIIKKDKATNEAAIVEEGQPQETLPGTEEKDHISKEELPPDQRYERYIRTVNEAVICIQDGLCDKAVEKLKTAVALEPTLPYAYANLANAYYHLHNYREALAMSDKAIKIDPESAQAHGNLGNVYYALGKYKEAKASYQKAKELFQKKGDLEGASKASEGLAQPFLP